MTILKSLLLFVIEIKIMSMMIQNHSVYSGHDYTVTDY